MITKSRDISKEELELYHDEQNITDSSKEKTEN